MSQTLHILRKDIRKFRFHIALTLLLMALFGWNQSRLREITFLTNDLRQHWEMLMSLASVMQWMIPLAWWILIAQVIQEEALPGDRQFWLTRPYRRGSLAGAKLLFLFCFVSLPFLVSDGILLASGGIDLSPNIQRLLVRHAVDILTTLMPAVALAALTRNLAEFVFASVACLALFIAASTFSPQMGAANLPSFSIYSSLSVSFFLSGSVILWNQYRRRRTVVSGVCFVCAFLLPLLLPRSPLLLEAAFTLDASLQPARQQTPALVVDSTRKPRLATSRRRGWIRLDLPISVVNLPQESGVGSYYFRIHMDGSSHQTLTVISLSDQQVAPRWLRMQLERTFYEGIKNRPVRLQTRMYAQVSSKPRIIGRVPLLGKARVPTLGVCEGGVVLESRSVSCHVPEWITSQIEVALDGRGGEPTRSQRLRIDSHEWLSPMRRSAAHFRNKEYAPDSEFVFTATEPLGTFRMDLEIPQIRLGDAEPPPAGI